MRSLPISDVLFDAKQVGQKWLVLVKPDGSTSIDGGHVRASEVAKALHLHNSISIIRPPEGTRAFMVTVEEVPGFKGRVNNGAINTLNRNLGGGM